MKKSQILICGMAIALVAGSSSAAFADTLNIQTSMYPYYEFTKNVVGNTSTVSQFIPHGANAHNWEPSVREIQELRDVDIFVYNGLGVDTFVDRLTESEDWSDIMFVKATTGLALIQTEEFHEIIDSIIDAADEMTAQNTISEIEQVLRDKRVSEILELFDHGDITKADAMYSINELMGKYEFATHGGEVGRIIDQVRDAGITAQDGLTAIATAISEHGAAAITTDTHDMDHEEHGHEEEHDGHAHENDHKEHTTEEEHGHDDEHDGHAHENDHEEHTTEEEHGHDDDHKEHMHDEEHDHEHAHGVVDPHVWLDVILVKQQVQNIRDAMIEIDSENAEMYTDNARSYLDKLDKLHQDYTTGLSNCQHDTLVTFHSAFEYLVERYGLKAVAISGLTHATDVSTADIVNMVEFIKDNDIQYVFTESFVDTRSLDAIAEDADVEILELSPIEAITEQEFADGVTYIDKMNENLDALKTGLNCQ